MHKGIMTINFQQCLKVCFLPIEETIPDNLALTKKLGLTFGKDIISFEKIEFGS